MPSKKHSRGPVSKISSAADPASSGTKTAANKSSVIRSAFSPSEYQLALFASVIQGLDAHHLRIHDINTGRLRCDHAVNPKESMTSLDWGYFGDLHDDRDQHLKKKRKRNSGVNGIVDVSETSDAVVAFGTSSSEIRMFSPAEGKVVGVLTGGHERGIRDFRFTVQKPAEEGWSIGGDGKLIQWNLQDGSVGRVITLPSTAVGALASPVTSNPPVLCASQTPYLIDLENENQNGPISFSAMRNTVHTLISSSNDLASLSEQFLAADSDRYINLFDIETRKLLGSLVTDKEVESVALYPATPKSSRSKNASTASRSSLFQKQLLAAVTRDGVVELFSKPFYHVNDSKSTTLASLKSRLKASTRRSEAAIKIVKPDASRTVVPIISVSFDGPDLVVAWVEAGSSVVFDRIRWQEEDTEKLMLHGESEIVRGKSASTIGSAMLNGVKNMGKTHVDESHVIVEQGGVAEGVKTNGPEEEVSASSDEEEQASDEEQELLEAPSPSGELQKKERDDVDMEDIDAEAQEEEEEGEPSFGELLHANTKHVDVIAELEEANTGALVTSHQPKTLQKIPSGLSLATVLSQSLKTNDNSLLESCFHTTDVNIVRATIQRLDSSLAGILLQKLAERLSSRPGRYGHLLVWVQWTCVAHGGSIAGNTEILNQMSSLFKVMDQRSASLPSLLLLKGKLDMLDAQLSLRRNLNSNREERRESDEEDVIYVEGQEDILESDDQERLAIEDAGSRHARDIDMGDMSAGEEDEEDEDDMPMVVNGVASDSEDEEGDDELIDDEAIESDDASGQEGEEEEEDEEDEAEEQEDIGSLADFIADSDEDSEAALEAPVPVKKPKVKKSKSRA
ncbi:Small subunit (SSU) processome component [Ophidiomyces ophidiicola]|nr:Small subunit (SSU) processome component [Ophidiomyces ophidiicola]KAI2007468.1 Small subunit (SSU) processome component [Ophidiomyces ophidiicola]KAI2011943.1 Small subunit (SSU) processome component [Ophidiomyces ophidiicola]KAI2019520.1 Small subunit (SSU) processome component [Ophidiomyces ophidiicola]KAI2036076.1 Small subunit (SSU) processome component [Ophidiomyces ophidiicola]